MTNHKYPQRGEVYWVELDPTVGAEINKTRPAVIVSNNAGNKMSYRVIIAPITSSSARIYPFESGIFLNNKKGKALLDQVRSIDKKRLKKKIGKLDPKTMQSIDKALKIALSLS